MGDPSVIKQRTRSTPATLGDVLYANTKAPVTEQTWATLVQSIAARDQLALHTLYEMAHAEPRPGVGCAHTATSRTRRSLSCTLPRSALAGRE